jgi:hypothetical protein
VYPKNASPVFPDYDGFCGFRNNSNADFYLVQISPTKVEARFRNSTGTVFDILDSALQLNAWQHYVLTYNGSYLSLYRNGVLKQSISATGTITNTAEDFYMGNLIYISNNFYLNGRLDEVSLWNKSLNASEVMCIYKSYARTNATGLLLYYKFNQGVANGNNVSVNTLLPQAGTLNGTLQNFTLSGLVSNWVSGIQNYTPANATICNGQPVTFGTQQLTTQGIYYEAFTGASGCDSVVRMVLTDAVNKGVNQSGYTLTSMQSGGTYQWVDCNNGYAALAGDTLQSFTPATDGAYAVVVSYNNCTDTSNCQTVIGIGTNEISNADAVSVFPNPVTNELNITGIRQTTKIEILDLSGRVTLTKTIDEKIEVDVSNLSDGIYYLKINQGKSTPVLKLVKKSGD